MQLFLKKFLHFIKLHDSIIHGSLVKRLRRRPLTAETRVRFPYGLLTEFNNLNTAQPENIAFYAVFFYCAFHQFCHTAGSYIIDTCVYGYRHSLIIANLSVSFSALVIVYVHSTVGHLRRAYVCGTHPKWRCSPGECTQTLSRNSTPDRFTQFPRTVPLSIHTFVSIRASRGQALKEMRNKKPTGCTRQSVGLKLIIISVRIVLLPSPRISTHIFDTVLCFPAKLSLSL